MLTVWDSANRIYYEIQEIDLSRDSQMGVLDALRSTDRNVELYECRNCGEKLSKTVETCPTCDSEEIAHYVF